MSERPKKSIAAADLSAKARRIGWVGSVVIRVFALTFRWRLHDPDGVSERPPDHPMIWTFWHNRIFVLPVVYPRYFKARRGAILTSASKDGEIIASVCSHFGVAAVRGSSSRRGVAALLGLIDWINDDYDVAVVPDGPRGPRYRLGPGIIKLAQMTDAKILPIRVEYGSAWIFKSWDRFQLPKPFTTVNVYLEPLESVPENLDDEAFEKERQRIETVMNPDHETD
tara:strand:- start:592 stop:1266 length:675 start_codon:yes stop_codon:yes gene_type:complete